jgi:hypothetical protein
MAVSETSVKCSSSIVNKVLGMVSKAWKGGDEIGPPKWNHNQLVTLSPRPIEKLSRLQN